MTTSLYKKGLVLAIIGLFIGAGIVPSIASMEPDNVNTEVSTSMAESKKWTWMFYDDADFYRAYDPLENFSEEAYSSENLDVIVLQDKEHGPASMWYVDENHNIEKLEEMGEINMGDKNTLQNFVQYCKDEYPAERYILSMYNHGRGCFGACIDDTSDGDILTMDEMQNALTKTGGVDILCFTAPCNMGSVESVYEMRDCVDVYIGSEEGSGYGHWWGTIENMCNVLNENPNISNNEFGEDIIQSIWDETPWQDSITMSAVRTDKIEDLVNQIDKFCTYLYENFDELFNKIRFARLKSKEVMSHRGSVDLIDFVQNYYDVENTQFIFQHVQNITDAFNEAVIRECHGVEYDEEHGLHIFFPLLLAFYGYPPSYGDTSYGLDFSQDTSWNELLEAYNEKEWSQPFIITLLIRFLVEHFPWLFNILL